MKKCVLTERKERCILVNGVNTVLFLSEKLPAGSFSFHFRLANANQRKEHYE